MSKDIVEDGDWVVMVLTAMMMPDKKMVTSFYMRWELVLHDSDTTDSLCIRAILHYTP